MKDTILSEIQKLLEQQPLLTLIYVYGGANITGKYKICNQLEDEVFEDYFALEIFIPDDFPDSIPTVKTTDKRIRARNYREHIYSDGKFCLETNTAMAAFLLDCPSLLAFLSQFLDTYLCGFLYFQKHQVLPFGEHKHGILGLLEYYCELFKVAEEKSALGLLACLLGENPKGHIRCPCESGRRYRNCHRERINELRTSKMYEWYKNDFVKIASRQAKR